MDRADDMDGVRPVFSEDELLWRLSGLDKGQDSGFNVIGKMRPCDDEMFKIGWNLPTETWLCRRRCAIDFGLL
jgi:hypothetical protein